MYLGFTIAFYLLWKIKDIHIYVYGLNKAFVEGTTEKQKILKNIWMVGIIQELGFKTSQVGEPA